jgi:hypothetical protein
MTMVDFCAMKAPTAPTQWNMGLCMTNPLDDASALAAQEPTIGTGAYARSTSIGSTAANWTTAPTPTADAAAVSANAVAVTFAASTAAFSSGASTLGFYFGSLSTTLQTEVNYIGRGSITNPVAVNTSGVTLSFAIAALSFTCISV